MVLNDLCHQSMEPLTPFLIFPLRGQKLVSPPLQGEIKRGCSPITQLGYEPTYTHSLAKKDSLVPYIYSETAIGNFPSSHTFPKMPYERQPTQKSSSPLSTSRMSRRPRWPEIMSWVTWSGSFHISMMRLNNLS